MKLRFKARWFARVEDVDPENPKYSYQVCATELDAARLADKNDINHEGFVETEELRFYHGLPRWEHLENRLAYEVLERAEKR